MAVKEILDAIQRELSAGLLNNGYVCRIGSVFFRCKDCGCVQRDLVHTLRKKYKVDFELLSLDWEYFTGSEIHALALKDALGGKVYPSEYVAAADPNDIWIWEGPHRDQGEINPPLDVREMKKILFDEN